jgi:metallo-beta-lactamase family protein
MITLTFLGAAQTVTGSKHLLTVNNRRVLFDCGLFQGQKALRERNWHNLPFNAASLDAVVLTHAHLDHSGYLPKLVAAGFKGRIFCTPGTLDLCRLVLPDAGRIQEEDARQANRHGYTKHQPALPLFTEVDAFHAIDRLQPVGYERPIEIVPGVEVDFIPAGHLLGSAYARARIIASGGSEATSAVGGSDTAARSESRSVSGLRILFGGDLGRYDRPVLRDPAPVAETDILLVESTYGDRQHEVDDDGHRLAEIITRTAERGGKVVVPAFAIGRTEEVLFWIKRLEEQKRIPVLPVFVDSPMAVDALEFYSSRRDELDAELGAAGRALSAFATTRFQTVETPQHSKEVTASRMPSIVISASGMATGGRVLHHLKAALPNARNTVLFVGFQAEGTRGRQLIDGARTVKIHGAQIPVAASIERLDSMSAHADQREILRWLRGFTRPPRMTYLVHGEPGPMATLQQVIEAELGWPVHMPALGESVEL